MEEHDSVALRLYRWWFETLTGWIAEFFLCWCVIPIQLVAAWLSSTWTGIGWLNALLLVVLAWGLNFPVFLVVRNTLGHAQEEGGYKRRQMLPATVIGRVVSNTVAFTLAATSPLAGGLVGLATGAVTAGADLLIAFPPRDDDEDYQQERVEFQRQLRDMRERGEL
ncbi:hypothetical protein [Actinopolyspora mortivallis]|uniref:Uncharacterized protein n=1 Tax=Actinopolyspora mortivallis TaxID=33906 RepID=A0A2T0GT65_ACTMO|nr:hypothetical protein [Actinopolyspora mortivallis]PRW62290.1 hypothetical protein CEP50_16275 [Actinopolyspora mortivallis]